MRRFIIAMFCAILPAVTSVSAESNQPGIHIFGSEAGCRSSGKLSERICSNAALNARAEFREKAPSFPSRLECEKLFRRGCSIGIRGAAGWAGKT